MTRIKRFYDVHEPNENFFNYGVSITSEMAFTESLLLRKGHFLSRKRGRLFKKYFFRSLNGAFKPRKRALFHFKKKWGGAQAPIAPPPVPRPLLVRSHLSFGCELWAPQGSSADLLRLEGIQRRATKFILHDYMNRPTLIA